MRNKMVVSLFSMLTERIIQKELLSFSHLWYQVSLDQVFNTTYRGFLSEGQGGLNDQ